MISGLYRDTVPGSNGSEYQSHDDSYLDSGNGGVIMHLDNQRISISGEVDETIVVLCIEFLCMSGLHGFRK
jgi:hypothetical protein